MKQGENGNKNACQRYATATCHIHRACDIECVRRTHRCLNVRSATANRKKNRNVNEKRCTKSTTKMVFCHVAVPNAN